MYSVKFRYVHFQRQLVYSLAFRHVSGNSFYENSNEKILKVAIIGPPNAGKSTLVNALVGRRVCSASKKVHTTRHNIKAITVDGSTQLVFLDTPGIVTGYEMQRHRLERAFISNPEEAMLEADVIGVVHDVSNKWTAKHLDHRTLRLLELHSDKNSILILNKIDALHKKYKLLELINILTNKSVKSSCPVEKPKVTKLSEISVMKMVKDQHGWSEFNEVFMVSSLTGSGLGDVKEYLLQQAKLGPWIYKPGQFTDESPEDLILQTVHSRLLEYLPQEIPYILEPEMEFFKIHPDGRIVSVVLVNCPSPHLEKLVMGPKGKRIKLIAQEAEQDIRNTFHENVYLKLVVTGHPNKNVR
ncbi:hypothetical protein R5R35_009392 [Gryllus longicercus]|uniref:GTPase Era, mitochondrial n=1 Tax=Gryllus longicercus TaxID=2509291 RepID=A0AAN9Z261_9ORTH